jgi:hypothetical protein
MSRRKSMDFHDHSLVSARLACEKSEGPFVDYLQALYEDRPPDLIIAIGAPAANFVQKVSPAPLSGNADGLHGRSANACRDRKAY